MATGTTEDVRRANLSAILRILYHGGPASRTALSKRTGRNRSTIGSLVTDLVELGIVVEREPDSLGQVGRPSPVVSIGPKLVALAVNPEIDVLTIGLVGLDGRLRRTIRHECERIPSAAEVVSITAAVIAGMQLELEGLLVAGVGVAGDARVDGEHEHAALLQTAHQAVFHCGGLNHIVVTRCVGREQRGVARELRGGSGGLRPAQRGQAEGATAIGRSGVPGQRCARLFEQAI